MCIPFQASVCSGEVNFDWCTHWHLRLEETAEQGGGEMQALSDPAGLTGFKKGTSEQRGKEDLWALTMGTSIFDQVRIDDGVIASMREHSRGSA